MEDVRREIARLQAHLRLRAIVGIGAIMVLVFAMGGADVVARTAVAFVETDGWSVDTKNAAGNDVRRLTVTSDVDTARVKVTSANIELAQQASLPATPAAGAMAYDTTDNKFKVYDGTLWVVPAVAPTRTVVTKPVDESVTYSTVLQDDDHLTFAIGANETWVADFWIQATAASTGGIKYAISTPSGAASVRYWVLGSRWKINPDYYVRLGMGTASGAEINCDASSPQTNGHRIHVAITNGATAGNVTLQWAQQRGTPSPTTVKAGSRLIATKIQ